MTLFWSTMNPEVKYYKSKRYKFFSKKPSTQAAHSTAGLRGAVGGAAGSSSDDAFINENMPPARCQVHPCVSTPFPQNSQFVLSPRGVI